MYGSYKKDEVEKNVRYELTRVINITENGSIDDGDIEIYLENPLTIIELNSVSKKDKSVEYKEKKLNFLNNKNNKTNVMEEITDQPIIMNNITINYDTIKPILKMKNII